MMIIPIVRAVDHCSGNVLIHEEQQRQAESKAHSAKDRRPLQIPQRRWLEYLAVDHFELVH